MKTTGGNIDWITATSNSDRIGGAWYQIYLDHKYRLGREGAVYEENFSNGFYHGLSCEGLRWGYSERLGYILIASGVTARDTWQHMLPAKHRITRLDLCADFLFDEPTAMARGLYENLLAEGPKIVKKCSYFTNNDGGDTLYVGSRQSPAFGRIYDKGVEAGRAPAGHQWRLEIEYKKPLAGQIAAILMTFREGSLSDTITKMVVQWFVERGVVLGGFQIGTQMGTRVPIFVEERVTTATKKLAWLRGQVAPTVSRLIEAGLGKEVLHTLLLDRRQVLKILADEEDFSR